jgi:hypothetical protein
MTVALLQGGVLVWPCGSGSRYDGVALRPLGEATVRGKANAVNVFTLGSDLC